MTEESMLARVSAQVERGLGVAALAAYRRPLCTVVLLTVVTVLAAASASRLRLNSDLTELLPKSFHSVQDLDKLTQRFGGAGWVIVVGRDAEPAQLRRFADELAPKLAALPLVSYVDYQRPSKFFEERALYFLDVADLESLRDQLAARIAWEKRTRNPLYLDLEESEPPELELVDLQEKYAGAEGDSEGFWLAKQLGEPYYIDEKQRLVALMAKPARSGIDLSFSVRIVDEVESLLATLDLRQYGESFRAEVTGRYKKRVDLQRLITADLKLASLLSALLMILYVALHFRRWLAVGLLMTPLFVGQTWVFGFAAAAFGTLNILTGFVGAILFGLGIDHGIHLLSRFEAEAGPGVDPEEVVRRTFGRTGRGVVVAGLTTIVAFLGLSVSEFRPFREFGLVCAAGIALLVVSFTLLLPALLRVATRFGWRPRQAPGGVGSTLHLRVQRWARPIFFGALGLTILAVFLVPRARFDYDFAALEANDLPSYVLDRRINRVLGFNYVPVAVLTDSLADERTISAALRARKRAAGKGANIDFVASSADMLPLHQEEKLPVIRQIGEVIADLKPEWLPKGQMRERFELLQRMVAAVPFGREDLPEQLKLLFKGIHGTGEEGFVLVFPSFKTSEGKRVVAFANDVRGVPLPDGRRVSAAGEELLLADILTMVAGEAPVVLSWTLVAVVLTLLLLMGSMRRAALCLVPPFFTLLVTLALLPFVDLELNYLNIVMIPLLFGVGVDGGAHLLVGLSGNANLGRVLPETGRAIVGSLTTSLFGFGTVLLAHHHGLRSFGLLAGLGLLVNILASLVVMPAVLYVVKKR